MLSRETAGNVEHPAARYRNFLRAGNFIISLYGSRHKFDNARALYAQPPPGADTIGSSCSKQSEPSGDVQSAGAKSPSACLRVREKLLKPLRH